MLLNYISCLGWQVWNKEIPWQPVPIHTVAGDDVMMRPNDVPCARLTQIWKEQKSDPEYIKMAVGHQQLLKELSQHAGMEVTPTNLAQITGNVGETENRDFKMHEETYGLY